MYILLLFDLFLMIGLNYEIGSLELAIPYILEKYMNNKCEFCGISFPTHQGEPNFVRKSLRFLASAHRRLLGDSCLTCPWF